MYDLEINLAQRITFVLTDALGAEVTGLGGVFNINISKNGATPPVAGLGAKGEIGLGWYYYDLTAAETDTSGPLSVSADGVGTQQQNLEYIILTRVPNATPFTYTVTNSVTLQPIPDVSIWISTDIAGSNIIWNGTTDAFGVARDINGNLPYLPTGTFYFWKNKVGLVDDQNPDTEVVP
jgi:hypothetical protein